MKHHAQNQILVSKIWEGCLCPVPFSIAFPDGSKRSTAQSKLSRGVWVLGVSDAIISNISQQINAYILNGMAKIPSLHEKPDTFEEVALKLVKCFQKGKNKVHFVGDSYLHNIKAAERKTRLEKSMKSKIQADFQAFVKK